VVAQLELQAQQVQEPQAQQALLGLTEPRVFLVFKGQLAALEPQD